MKKSFQMVWFAALTLTLLLTACGGGGSGDPIIEGPQLPVARISTQGTALVGVAFQLDGRNSSDSGGVPFNQLAYRWSIVDRPPNSTAQLTSTSVINPQITPDVAGNYRVQLIVNNGTRDSLPAFAAFTATAPQSNTPPIADLGFSTRNVGLGFPVHLNASSSRDPDGHTLEYTWELQKPVTSSAALVNLIPGQNILTSFTPDSPGEYRAILTVSDGQASTQTSATITAIAAFFRTYGDTGFEEARAVAELADGYLIAGESNSTGIARHGSYDLTVFRTDRSGGQIGNPLVFGDADLNETWAMDININPQGTQIALAGYTQSFDDENAYFVESDLAGSNLQEDTFGGINFDQAQAVRYTSDGGILLCGFTRSQPFSTNGDAVMMTVKIGGASQFQRGYGASSYQDCWAVEENENGYILAGVTETGDINAGNAYLIQINKDNGNIMWEGTFGALDAYDEFYALKATQDGGFIAAGYTESFPNVGADGNMYLVKIPPAFQGGNNLATWQKAFGDDNCNEARAVQETLNDEGIANGYILAGFTDYIGFCLRNGDDTLPGLDDPDAEADVHLVKVDLDGNTQWQRRYGVSGRNVGWSVVQTEDGGFLIGGDTNAFGNGNLDMLLIKTDSNGRVPPIAAAFTALEQNEGTPVNIPTASNFKPVQDVPLTFTAIGLPPGTSIISTTGLIEGTLPTVTADTVYRITVIATDPDGLSAAETLTLTVSNTN